MKSLLHYIIGNIYTGELLVCDTPTKTGRVYPLDVIKNAVDEYNNRMTDRFGRFVQDTFFNKNIQAVDNISHRVLELSLRDNKVYAEIEILNTVKGNIISEMLKYDDLELFAYGKGICENNVVSNYSFKEICITYPQLTGWNKTPLCIKI